MLNFGWVFFITPREGLSLPMRASDVIYDSEVPVGIYFSENLWYNYAN
jgi:hypothetical protein